jgi:hypothetical protein
MKGIYHSNEYLLIFFQLVVKTVFWLLMILYAVMPKGFSVTHSNSLLL